jgi:plastocyanin domain-containing protein
MNKTALSIIIAGVIVFIALLVFAGPGSRNNLPSGKAVQNSEIRDGVQYITIDAKGGYSPNSSVAKAGIPTKLIVKTNGTYDCSASLVIRQANFQEILPQTGTTTIDIGTPKAGESLQGVCGMGMYSFVINFT